MEPRKTLKMQTTTTTDTKINKKANGLKSPCKKKEIIYKNILDLDESLIEPEARMTPHAVKDILETISYPDCEINAPIVLWKDEKTIVDGHRRWMASQIAGFKQVPCIVYTGKANTPQEAFAELNRTKRGHPALEWLESCVKDHGSTTGFPTTVQGNIRACKKIFGGLEGLRWLLEHKTAPTVATTINKLHSNLEQFEPRLTPKTVGTWMVVHGTQAIVKNLRTHGLLSQKLLKKIHKKIRLNEGFGKGDLV